MAQYASQPVDIKIPFRNGQEQQRTRAQQEFKQKLFLFLLLGAVYLLIVASQVIIHFPVRGGGFHFIYLADGWLHGHLYIHDLPPSLYDYTKYHGQWYVAFPPLPAILLLPFVAIFHLSHQGIISVLFSASMGILNIWLMLRALTQLMQKYATHGTGSQFAHVAWLTLLFALGTEHLYVTMRGSVWFLAHVVATTFVLLAISEALDKRRPWLMALLLGLAALSRITTLLTFPFFLLLILATERKRPLVLIRDWSIFGTVLGLIVGCMLLYNQARFGSLLDFGYNTMNVTPVVGNNLHTYGQFNTHFIPTNLRYMLLEPPKLINTFPYISFSPFGTGIFWTMPALLLSALAFRHREHRWLTLPLLSACILPSMAFLLYFNTGWFQFGYRFALDFLPYLLLLTASGIAFTPKWLVKAHLAQVLIILSILVNIWGYIVFNYFRPPILGY